MNTTIWLREARERFGGGVPVSGRSASLAVFGMIGPGGTGRCPNSPLLSGVVVMTACRLNLAANPLRHSRGEYGKIDGTANHRFRWPTSRSTTVALETERCVGAAETNGIGQRHIDLAGARSIGHEIDCRLAFQVIQVD